MYDDVVFIQRNQQRNPKKGSSLEPLFRFHPDVTSHSCIKCSRRTPPLSVHELELSPHHSALNKGSLLSALNKGSLLRLDTHKLG